MYLEEFFEQTSFRIGDKNFFKNKSYPQNKNRGQIAP